MSARIWRYRRNKIRTVTSYDGRLLNPTDKLLSGGGVRIPEIDALLQKLWDNWSPEPTVFE